METTLNTSAELLRQIGYLADDENSLKKLLAYTKKLVTKKREAEEEPVQTKEEYEYPQSANSTQNAQKRTDFHRLNSGCAMSA